MQNTETADTAEYNTFFDYMCQRLEELYLKPKPGQWDLQDSTNMCRYYHDTWMKMRRSRRAQFAEKAGNDPEHPPEGRSFDLDLKARFSVKAVAKSRARRREQLEKYDQKETQTMKMAVRYYLEDDISGDEGYSEEAPRPRMFSLDRPLPLELQMLEFNENPDQLSVLRLQLQLRKEEVARIERRIEAVLAEQARANARREAEQELLRVRKEEALQLAVERQQQSAADAEAALREKDLRDEAQAAFQMITEQQREAKRREEEERIQRLQQIEEERAEQQRIDEQRKADRSERARLRSEQMARARAADAERARERAAAAIAEEEARAEAAAADAEKARERAEREKAEREEAERAEREEREREEAERAESEERKREAEREAEREALERAQREADEDVDEDEEEEGEEEARERAEREEEARVRAEKLKARLETATRARALKAASKKAAKEARAAKRAEAKAKAVAEAEEEETGEEGPGKGKGDGEEEEMEEEGEKGGDDENKGDEGEEEVVSEGSGKGEDKEGETEGSGKGEDEEEIDDEAKSQKSASGSLKSVWRAVNNAGNLPTRSSDNLPTRAFWYGGTGPRVDVPPVSSCLELLQHLQAKGAVPENVRWSASEDSLFFREHGVKPTGMNARTIHGAAEESVVRLAWGYTGPDAKLQDLWRHKEWDVYHSLYHVSQCLLIAFVEVMLIWLV